MGLVQTLLWAILAIILPPLAVGLKTGLGFHLLLNILLCIFTVWIGAIIHAMYVVFAFPTVTVGKRPSTVSAV